jgi:beta-N-acetylhexosaminidase
MILKTALRFFSVSLIICCCLPFQVSSQNFRPSPSDRAQQWVDSVYSALSVSERIGQLVMIRVNSDYDSAEIRDISRLVRERGLGGICFFKGGPLRQAYLTNALNAQANIPLLIAMDAEWGLGMRLDSCISFPRQMTMGAIQDTRMLTEYGHTIAAQLRRMGVNLSFSPVADINSNPANPVINIRSFGEQKEAVADLAIRYMKALQEGGILTVAKHFPGHGDTDTDSHHALPFIGHDTTIIENLDLYPFRALIRSGVDGMMVAHLNIPALEGTRDLPSSLSPRVVDSLLRKTLKFDGLVFTDALDMKGVSGYDSPGQLELRALRAGNDVLLLPVSADKAIDAIKQAVDSGWYPEAELELHCKRILAAKYRAGLSHPQPIETRNLNQDLHSLHDMSLNVQFYSKGITVLKNDGGLLPLRLPDTVKMATLTIGYDEKLLYQQRIDDYANAVHFTLPRNPDAKSSARMLAELRKFDLVIIAVNNTVFSPARSFGISENTIEMVDSLLSEKPCILNLFALPYSLKLFRNQAKAKAVTIGFQDNPDAYDAMAQILFGGLPASGKLPVAAGPAYPAGTGLITGTLPRLRYNPVEDTVFTERDFRKIDSLVEAGIKAKAYPGCQVLIARNGNVVYRKAFGFSDYSTGQAVKNDDLYDLASVTKVAATTLAVMKLYEEGKVNLDEPLSKTLKYLENSNKNKITIREVMTHQAGLVAWIPFYKNTLRGGMPDTLLYAKTKSDGFPYRVAEGMYLRRDYRERILDSIVRSPLSSKKEYKYSDLGFILMQQFVEQKTGVSLDSFMDSVFYRPLGLSRLGYHPADRFPLSRIMPTENDTLFRHQLIHGDVHDPAAAMLGGVAGHAGLFGTSNDMAVLLQMLLQKGSYGGTQYLKPETVALFTKRQFPGNRRGLGFDKPQLNPAEAGPACEAAPASSFGHTGFTGTYIWADPENNLLIVFLSNRVNPDAEPNRLVQLGTRTHIQEILYESINRDRKAKQPVKRKPVDTTLQ